MILGYFGIQQEGEGKDLRKDRAYLPKLQEIVGAHHIKLSLGKPTDVQMLSAIAAKVRAAGLDAAIVSDENILSVLAHALDDYKPVHDRRGVEKQPKLNDWHGSIIKLPGKKLGFQDREYFEFLILNPLPHLRTVPEAPFIFKRLITKLTKPAQWFPQTNFTWEVLDANNAVELFARFQSATLCAVDIETPEDNPFRTIDCVGYCGLFADGSTHTVVIPTKNSEWALGWVQKFNDLPCGKIMQNGLYDAVYFMRWNCPLRNWLWDTNILFHCWYAELPKDLAYLTAFSIRNIRYWKEEGKTGKWMDKLEYNAKDCWATMMAFLSLMSEAPDWAIKNYQIEFPLVFPCITCELDGFATDKVAFDKSLAEVEAKIAASEKKLQTWVHPDFNPRSSQQCQKLLFILGYRWKTGSKPSADDETLTAAAAMSPFNAHILEEIQHIRSLLKLASTYLVWEKIWNERLYYKLNPAGTDTGRLASAESSFWCGLQIQNMTRGPEVKSWLRADPGWLLAEPDFAQSEARCVGYLSGCTTLIDLVEGPHDYHAWNAQDFFGVPYETIYDETRGETLNKALRDLSKRTNHGANYNMGPDVMLETMGPKAVAGAKSVLGLPASMSLRQVCEFLLNQYAKTYPEVKVDYQKWLIRTIQLTKKLVSPLGWTRYCFSDPGASKHALNMYVAHSPQNLSVGIINRTFYRVWRETIYGELRNKVRLKAQIHDSLPFQYRIEHPEARLRVVEMMREPVPVKDIKGVTRTLLIPPDVSEGATHWSMLK